MIIPVVYLIVGVALLLGVLLPAFTTGRAISAPVILVAAGALVGLLPFPAGLSLDPVNHPAVTEHLTEITILMALTGVGLALDRPLTHLRSTWRRWGTTWRLLLIAMPLAIAGTALLGWWLLGLIPAAAVLLGSVLAPTDPVLAAEVQVEGPTTLSGSDPDDGEGFAEADIDEKDEVRFALTSEAGLNDGAAFPFVYASIFLLTMGSAGHWWVRWIGWEVVGKTVVGIAAGWAVGRLLSLVAFRIRESVQISRIGDPLLIVAAPLIAYGVGELVHGWGFLSVFVSAITLRSCDRSNQYHDAMHGVIERLERLFTLVVLLLLGASLTNGLLTSLTWQGAAVAFMLIFVIRPVTAWIALWHPRGEDFDDESVLGPRERLVTAFFGVRGVGSIYYLAYATGHHAFPEAEDLWSIVAFTIVLSVVVHGVSASPIIGRLERRREAVLA
ncbi:sodium:proton antiporter [Allobranchiibius sp. CTAmp26]|uniref:cation:proton antiporter n=1 Tax=Allobranchiibius sp. CTAmp26 TaxID=2815214 RepID=UPI001AA1A791|nr:cation:proton antiporter [Allobranchiibius sp. CTAmp26]MBO1754090.1 cation:proton antiporter [Allobranchiibius sp. CTAmp26]